MSDPQIRYARTSDGVNIAYLRAGAGPILVDLPVAPFSDVQRLTQSPAIWAATMVFAPGLTYVSYDNRGSGGSDRNVTQFSIETDLLDLDAVVGKLDVAAVTLLAAGPAGPTAIAYAARHPERVDRLVLLGTWAKTEITAELEAILSMMGTNYRLFTDTLAHVIMGFGTGEAAREQAELMRGCTSPETAAAILNAHRGDDVRDLVPQITAPALVIDFEAPGMGGLSEGSRYLAANLPNAQLLRGGADWGATVGAGSAAIHDAVEAFVHGTHVGTVAPTSGGTRTVLFTDIVGHTEMMQRLGDAKGRDVLREHERITRDLLRQHGGAEVKTMGDGFMASFGSVTSAMDCAIALQRAFAAHTDSMPEPLHVRVGLNAGEPIEEDGDLFGATVILASRIAAKAGAGEILVPDTVRGLLSGKNFLFGDRGEFVPKGFDETVRLWDVRWKEEA
jgi:class 3 adenylate cyclase